MYMLASKQPRRIGLFAFFMCMAILTLGAGVSAVIAGAEAQAMAPPRSALSAPLAPQGASTTYVVTQETDTTDGTCDANCTLREAIEDANANGGTTDTIEFDIPGGGVHAIALTSTLPTITDPVIIDGYTQTGAFSNTLATGNNATLRISLNGEGITGDGDGLVITAGNSTVRGLAINRFSRYGISLQTNGNNKIEGNFIGTNAAGTTDLGNGLRGVDINSGSGDNTIGGTQPWQRNVISGNDGAGVNIWTIAGTGNRVQGNFIGTDKTGTLALGNGNYGIDVKGRQNQIGGNANGAGNLISGNTTHGISVWYEAHENTIRGNLIGTTITGTAALPNMGSGIDIWGAMSTTIASNLISGNDNFGISVSSVPAPLGPGGGSIDATNTIIQGNFIGTDINGTYPVPNFNDGISLVGTISSRIGGSLPAARNLISGNAMAGIKIRSDDEVNVAHSNVVLGNYIGTDVTGQIAIPNTDGILMLGAYTTTIGGPNAGEGNTISGNVDDGIVVDEATLFGATSPHSPHGFTFLTSNATLIQGNSIGTDAQRIGPVPNGGSGVDLDHSNNSSIGGLTDSSANTIAYNTGDGITVGTDGTNNSILTNAIFGNGSTALTLGIDLAPDGVNANDAGDADTGANNKQNYPVLTSASVGTGTTVVGSLNSAPSMTYTLRFFSSNVCDTSGYGEGQIFLGTYEVTTGGDGNVNFSAPLAQVAEAGDYVTSTATDPNGNTSEFSACVTSQTATPTPTASTTSTRTATGTATRTATSTVTRTATQTATRTSTGTATRTATSTPTQTPVASSTDVPTATATGSSGSPTSTTTNAATNTPTVTRTNTPVTGGSITVTATSTACPIQFQDVPSDYTFYSVVRCLACRNILGGYQCGGTGEPCGASGDPYFRPSVQISRGQIAKIVSQSAGLNDDPGTRIFEDVPEDSPFFAFIQRLTNEGHMGGYPCGQLDTEPCEAGNRPYFRPSSNATRGQLSKIVANAAEIDDPVAGQTYEDVPPESPFYLFIGRLSALNVMSGYPCGGPSEACGAGNKPYFRPNANVTRGQAAKIVANTFFPGCQTPARR